jgi:hypothetical protein
MKRKPTKEESAHMGRVAALGCIVCRNTMGVLTPAECHHIRDGYGAAQRAPHNETIPLCPIHHRNGSYGVAFHAGKQTWEEIYGTERELLEQVRGLLDAQV